MIDMRSVCVPGAFIEEIIVDLHRRRCAHRQKNPVREAAREIARKPREISGSAQERKNLNGLAKEYSAQVANTKSFATKQISEHIFKGAISRGETCWGRKYCKRVLRRFGAVENKGMSFGLTLTTIKKPDRSIREDLDLAQHAWNILMTQLRRKYPLLRFIRVWEIGRGNTNVHIHAVLFGLMPTQPVTSWIEERWEALTGATQIKISKGGRGIQHAIKYLAKGLKDGSKGFDGALFLWSAGSRRYSATRGMLPARIPAGYSWQGFLFGDHPGPYERYEPGAFYIWQETPIPMGSD
jgi:hypothetical protein